MGIKDKVINILFDEDENVASSDNTKNLSRVKNNENSSTFVDTAPIFIDANPTRKQNNSRIDNVKEIVEEIKLDEGYRMTENISPIFGIQKSETKNKKVSPKTKADSSVTMYDGLLNAGTNVSTSYSSVIISPIFGPLENKPTRKNPTRTSKKQADPFNRNIDDTGEFKTLYSRTEENERIEDIDFEPDAPNFEDAKVEKPVVDDKLGDTDRLSKISDRINQIKNEASHIYTPGKVEHIESRKEGKKEEHNTISDLIHNFQKEDFNTNFSVLNNNGNKNIDNNEEYSEDNEENVVIDNEEVIETENAKEAEPVYEENEEVNESINNEVVENEQAVENEPAVEDTKEVKEESDVEYSLDDTFNLISEKLDDNVSSSIDDVFEDDVDDTKDLFSDLFGDE